MSADTPPSLRELHDRLGSMIDQVGHPDYSLRELVSGLREVRDALLSETAQRDAVLEEALRQISERTNKYMGTLEDYYLHGLWMARDILIALKGNAVPQARAGEGSLPTRNAGLGEQPAESASTARCVVVPQDEYRVFKDGDAWCATGSGFVDLAESDAGFGHTPLVALGELIVLEGEK